jgi:ubiquinone/menaquinone biosynthesis C-methylase UbiE
MDRPRRTLYPEAAVGWMLGERPLRLLDLGSGRGAFAQMLVDAGHEVFTIDRDVERVASLSERLDTHRNVAGQVEALPFLACHFDVVTASQTLHRFAPGLALSEIARVLKPGGHLAVAYNTRDDTVPWVRRLIALMHDADPDSVTGDYGIEAVQSLVDSPFFGEVVTKSFRNWVPITREGLVAMVDRQPSMRGLDPDRRESLLMEVGELYDSSARSPEPLLLPYRATCWQSRADHTQLAQLEDEFDALEIRL